MGKIPCIVSKTIGMDRTSIVTLNYEIRLKRVLNKIYGVLILIGRIISYVVNRFFRDIS